MIAKNNTQGTFVVKTISGENVQYELILTKHALEERQLMYKTNNKRKKERLSKDLTLEHINEIIKPYVHKMVKTEGKYAINIGLNSNTNEFKMFIIAAEKHNNTNKLVLITAMNANFEKYMVFTRIPLNNRFTSSYTMDEIFERMERENQEKTV